MECIRIAALSWAPGLLQVFREKSSKVEARQLYVNRLRRELMAKMIMCFCIKSLKKAREQLEMRSKQSRGNAESSMLKWQLNGVFYLVGRSRSEIWYYCAKGAGAGERLNTWTTWGDAELRWFFLPPYLLLIPLLWQSNRTGKVPSYLPMSDRQDSSGCRHYYGLQDVCQTLWNIVTMQ